MIKDVHVTTVFISISVFIIRFYWMIIGSKLLALKPVKIIPHINDTILLVSAVALAINIGQYPFFNGWLTVKVVLLLVYILLGTVALKQGRKKKTRIKAGFAAVVVFAFMISVAMTRSPQGFLPF